MTPRDRLAEALHAGAQARLGGCGEQDESYDDHMASHGWEADAILAAIPDGWCGHDPDEMRRVHERSYVEGWDAAVARGCAHDPETVAMGEALAILTRGSIGWTIRRSRSGYLVDVGDDSTGLSRVTLPDAVAAAIGRTGE